MHPNTLYRWILAVLVVGCFIYAALIPSPAEAKGKRRTMSRTHIHVTCQEDEIVAPKQWVPGTPKQGLDWICVNAEDYIAGSRP